MISPVSLFVSCSLLWLLVTAFAPFSFSFKYEIYPALLIVGTAFLFILGCQLVRVKSMSRFNNISDKQRFSKLTVWVNSCAFKKIFWFAVTTAAVGCAIRAYDRLFVRGLLSASSTTEIRLNLLEMGESAGGLSIVAAIMFPWAYPVFFLSQLIWSKLNIFERWIVVVISFYPVAEGFIQGGTIAAATTLLYYYFCQRTLVATGLTVSRANHSIKLRNFAVLVTALIVAALIFIDRIESMFGDLAHYMKSSEISGTIIYSETAYWIVDKYGAFGFVPIWLMHYFSLGVHEFFYLVQYFDEESYFYGQYQFYIPMKLLNYFNLINGVSVETFYRVNPMPGHFQTFWGPAYMDFGSLILVEAFLIGVVSGGLYLNCCRSKLLALILYPYIQVNIILGFFASGIIGERFYYFVSLVFLVLICSISFRRFRYVV